MSRPTRAILLLAAAIGASACGKKQKGTYEVGQGSGDMSAADSLKAEADALWAERGDKAKLVAALAKYEQANQADPTNREIAMRLVRGHYFLGDAHETEKDAKNAAFDKAINFGKACLAINGDFKAKLEAGEKPMDAAPALGKDDVPCMYWTSSSLGKWAKLNGILTSLKHIDTVKAYMTRIGELDPSYYYYGPDRYWGAYYSLIPSFSGRDLDKSKKHFDVSIQNAPQYLGTKVLVADAWAVNSQNRDAYVEALQAVIDADPGDDPNIAAENRAEQAKAKKLLAQADERFAG